MSEGALLAADDLDVTVLVDNYTDLQMRQSTETVRRPVCKLPDALLAEHGLSCLLTVRSGQEEHVVAMDAGISAECLLHNAKVLGADLSRTEAVVLSHGHYDHYGGFPGLLGNAKRGTPVVLHPDALLPRRFNIPGVGISDVYQLDAERIIALGGEVVKSRGASTVASGLVQVSGEIERTTRFEIGYPYAEAMIGGNWQVDPFRDDQAVAVNVKGKGLVVISGCAHAGIVNSVEHLRKVTDVQKVHAGMGGFHLSGTLFEQVIPPTVEAIKSISPDHVVPMHCTGRKAMEAFEAAMPDRFRLNVVGTTYCFK